MKEENDDEEESENNKLPQMAEGDILTLKDMVNTQKFTKPSPRYIHLS